ncbi:MAG: hypothetical protein K6G27_14980 [Lachnospiraceae bacterium]|nr:hypothetical protein [Lachnospiraceae bacterium]
MATYITNISSDRLKELLIKLRKEDTLIIFHSSDEKQIPIEMITLFANAKGTVEFRESEDDLAIAFEIGKIAGASAVKTHAPVEVIGESPVFDKIIALMGGKKKQAPKSSKASAAPKAESISPDPASNSVKTSETKSKTVKSSTSKSTAGKKAKGKDLIAFDDAFDMFTGLMDSLKTDKYDPTGCSMGIISAIRLMNENPEVTFEKALPTTATAASAKKFLSQISKENIDKVIEAAREVVKYDN